MQDQVAEQFI